MHQEWSPKENERVHAWFYTEWHTATVRRVFHKADGPHPGLHAEVLWDSEYSTSELPTWWLVAEKRASTALPPSEPTPSNVETEAPRPQSDHPATGGPVLLAPSGKPFAPPPGLEGMNQTWNLLESPKDSDQGGHMEPDLSSTQAEPIEVKRPQTCSSRAPPKGHVANVPPVPPPSVPPSIEVARPLRKRAEGPSDPELRAFVNHWSLSESSRKFLKGLPGFVQQEVVHNFRPGTTVGIDPILHTFARRIWDAKCDTVDLESFVENWGLDQPTSEYLESLPLDLQKQVVRGFHPPSEEKRPMDIQIRRFAHSIADKLHIPLPRERSNSGTSSMATTKATETGGSTPAERDGAGTPAAAPAVPTQPAQPKVWNQQEELLSFSHRYHVKGVALQTLKSLPTEQMKQVLSEFEPKSGPRDVDKALLSYINNLGKSQPKPQQSQQSQPQPQPQKARREETKTPKTPKTPITTPSKAPEVQMVPKADSRATSKVSASEVSKETPKKPQEKMAGIPMPARAVPVKPKTGGFALLHESTSEEEQEESHATKQKPRKKDASTFPDAKQDPKGAVKSAVLAAEEKKQKKQADESRKSKDALSDATEKKLKKKAEKQEKQILQSPPMQCEMPSMEEMMAPVEDSPLMTEGKKKSKLRQPEVTEIPHPDLWDYDGMCLNPNGDAISLPKTKLATDLSQNHLDFATTASKVDSGDGNPERSKNALEEESTACHGSEIFDDSGDSAGEDNAEEKENCRRMLRERATQQRVGRTRRNQKMRIARRCPEAQSKPCKDPRCENCSNCSKKVSD